MNKSFNYKLFYYLNLYFSNFCPRTLLQATASSINDDDVALDEPEVVGSVVRQYVTNGMCP